MKTERVRVKFINDPFGSGFCSRCQKSYGEFGCFVEPIGSRIGTIKIFGPHKKYYFYPKIDDIYASAVLREIAEFIEKLNE